MTLWAVLAVVAVLVLALVLLYNRLVRLRNRVDNAWAQVGVQLRRRYDLIPNLVETAKGYAAHERATFEEVTAARTRAVEATGVEQQVCRGVARPRGGARVRRRARHVRHGQERRRRPHRLALPRHRRAARGAPP